MNKKKFITLSSIVVFGILVLFMMVQKGTLSTEEFAYVFDNKQEVSLYKNELQELVKKTAKAFYNNRGYMKYRTGNMLGLEGIEYTYRDFTISPEELNVNSSVYFDDASFIYSVYMNALGVDLSDGLLESFDIKNGSGFVKETVVGIKNKNDSRLILESDNSSNDDKVAFASMFLKRLEIGDVIVYTKDGKYHLALFLGNNEDNSPECIYFTGDGMYLHNVNNYLFPNGGFLGDNSYYAIIRPINVFEFNPQDKTIANIPVNSLARENDIYIRRYTDVGTDNVYRGEKINFTIEIINGSDSEKQISKVVDVISNFLEFVEVEDGIYNKETYEVSWENIKIPANGIKTFTYEVKVAGGNEILELGSEGSVYGKDIIAGNAKVFFGNDKVMELNKINFEITNKYINDQESQLDSVLEQLNNVKSYLNYGIDLDDYKTNISEINGDVLVNEVTFNNLVYYNAFGNDLGENGFVDFDDIRDVLFLNNEENNGIYTRNVANLDDEVSKNINNMVVDNLYGGISLNDDKSKIFSSMINNNYTYNNLVSGDIIISWDELGNAVSYLIMKENNNGKVSVKTYSFSKDYGVVVSTLNERMKKIVDESSLYVVLRPSKVLDIELKEVKIDPINLSLDEEKLIVYSKKPENASVHTITYSDSSIFRVTDNVVKGIKTGSDMLKVTFNETVTKDVSVSVMLAIMGDIFVTDYKYDRANKIFFVGNETSVSKILSGIKFIDEGYEARIVDSNYDEVLDTINDGVSLEVKYNSDWIGNYKIVYYSLDLDNNVQVLEDEKIIRYIKDETTVKDFVEAIHINDDNAVVEFINKDNVKLEDSAALSTGDYLIFKINNKLNDQYQISVAGDVSGNGEFNGNDIVFARRHIVGWRNPRTGEIYEVSGVFEYAIDFSMNGSIDGNDVSQMRRKLVN